MRGKRDKDKEREKRGKQRMQEKRRRVTQMAERGKYNKTKEREGSEARRWREERQAQLFDSSISIASSNSIMSSWLALLQRPD